MVYDSYRNSQNPIVTLDIAGYGTMKIELFPDVAPNTVRNFVHLVQSGYYDGVGFHRIIENFMVQGGAGAPLSCRIAGEFSSNGADNPLQHTRGVISMARTMDPNSATGQFFIVHQNSPHLDGQYAAFGGLLEGFNFLDMIATTETGSQDRPLEDIIITRARVDTKGVNYPEPDCYQS
ncbi:MAG: peptidylprolyl isomerase [Acholeplasmatales bacterium]|nr:MAG: peptidylprolyl isomerase [Acholeplasmatales bacterium]